MTVLTQTNTQPAQAMNGVATVFAFTFRALVDFPDAIKVAFLDTLTDTETAGIKDDPGVNGYTVAINSNGIGGAVTVVDPKTSDDTITIYREYDLTQESNYADFNSFPANVVENDYDLGTMIDQQISELNSRAIVLPITAVGVSTELPFPVANAAIGWDPTATFLVNNPANLSQVAVDDTATPGWLGATGADGVLRVSGLLTYVDGGDFVTIGLTSGLVDHNATLNYLAAEHFTMLDEDDMVSDSNTQAATQQSIVAYVASQIATANEFVELTDTPAAYAGAALQIVRVNAAPNALEFVTLNADLVPIADSGGFYVATDVEGALAENRPLINANTAKVTNATHTQDVTGAGALTLDPVAITNKPAATVASGDLVLVADINDSNNLKQVTAQSIGDLGGGGGGATLTEAVVQATHGFSVNDWVYHNGTIYVLADASAAATAESIGIVSIVTDVNNFTLQFGGRITGLSGLTAGESHFLSETAGAITATAPTTEGAIIKPVLIADSTTSGFIFNMRGVEVVGTTSWYQSFADGDLTAGVLTVTHSLGHKYCQVQIFNNSDKMIMPDDITLVDANSLTVNLSSYGTLTGTWQVVVLDVGTTNSSVASDLALSGQVAGDRAVFNGTNWVRKEAAAFLAHADDLQLNFATGSNQKVLFPTESFDIGSNFASSTFTAPVDGVYCFQAMISLINLDSAATYYFGNLIFSGVTTRYILSGNFYPGQWLSADTTSYTMSGSVTIQLVAGQTCEVQIRQEGGTAQTDIAAASYFSGHLIA